MKDFGKRLLSWLIVLSMVLSMAPALDLSNFAVTTKAAENPAKDTLTAIENLRADFAGKTGTVSAICPVCSGEEVVEWTPLTGATAQLANPNGHYYLSGDVTFTAAGTTYNANNNKLCLNLNGNDITAGGIALNISYGNTVNVMDSAETDGIVTGTAAAFQGGAINIGNANAKVNIYGGTFKKAAGAAGSVVCIRNNGGEVNMYGGTIDASDASNSACASTINVMSAANVKTTFNLYGGLVKCGTMTAGGVNYRANIMLGYSNQSGATFNMEGGTVVGGNYTGAAGGGGATFAVVMGNTLKISGGTVYGGTSNSSGANIFSINNGAGNLEISGGTIVGEIYTRNAVDVKLSGDPQIVTSLEVDGKTVTATRGFDVSAAKLIDISELTADAKITVTGAKGVAFTAAHANAANVANAFTCTTAGTKVVAENNQLKIVDKTIDPDEFNPGEFDGQAYCQACMAQGINQNPVAWTALNKNSDTSALEGTAAAIGHFYLTEDMDKQIKAKASGRQHIHLNLNGCDVTTTDKMAIDPSYGYMSIMDTEGGAVVTGKGASGGSAVHVNYDGATVYLYGGTFKKDAAATNASVVGIGARGGIVHMYDGATIDATGTTTTAWAGTINIMGNGVGTFNMHGGTIKCGDMDNFNTNYQGNIHLGYGNYNGGATFNMEGGTVIGGQCVNASNQGGAGAFAVANNNTLNISGGTVYGGQSTATGGNIYIRAGEGTVDISGGTVVGDVCIAGEGTIKLSKNAKIVKELTIGDKTVTANRAGLQLAAGIVMDITGLTAGAEVYVAGDVDVALTTGTGVISGIKAYEDNKYVEDVEGVAYLRRAAASVVNAEGTTYYPTAAEALQNAEGGYIELHANAELELSDNAYVDAQGHNVTVTGTGTLYAMDSANDEYDAEAVGTWTVSGVDVATDVINPVNGNRYIVISENGAYSAHRVEMYLTHASLRTSQAGIYYKAAYKCDNTLAARVGGYGVALNLNEIPTQDNILAAKTQISVMGEAFAPNAEHTVNSTSTAVFGIFKAVEGRTNAAYGKMGIKATPYFVVDFNGDGAYDADAKESFVVGYVDDEVYQENAGVIYTEQSLFTAMKAIDTNWDKYEADHDQIQKFYSDWADWGMSEWADEFENIA